MRTFNTSGPGDPEFDYQLPPLQRSPDAIRLLMERKYVALSGPRQSGKTSLVRALSERINTDGWARSVVLSCEAADRLVGVEEIEQAENLLIQHWSTASALQGAAWPEEATAKALRAPAGARLFAFLSAAAVACDKPLVVILDEVDCLARRPFISALRQIRDGFQYRPKGFPYAMALCGLRNLREHDRFLGGDGSGSPFNIVHELTVTSFSHAEVVALYAQHTAETGQSFTDAAVDRAWEQTRGQPWLVNAIARLCVMEVVPDAAKPVELADVEEAIRRLEASNPTHLASLAARLREDRVLRVVAPVVVGDAPDAPPDDARYAIELGILERGSGEALRVSNPLYARSLLKLVTEQKRTDLTAWAPAWLTPDGRIDVVKLRENFLTFWSLHRGMMRDLITYPEAVPHFGLMTYLDRVVNGGGRVDREFAVGSGRLDLLVRYKDLRLPIEVKVRRDHRSDPLPEGLEQLDRSCEGLRVDTGWLVIFDQRSGASDTGLECREVVTRGGRSGTVIDA
jgi:hypothetical protein